MKEIRKFNDEYENWIMLEIQTILQIFFINCWYGEWLLVNEKVLLIMGLNENQ